jgi:hypothetical protein
MTDKIQRIDDYEIVNPESVRGDDFVTRALEHPQAKAVARNGRLSTTAKFYIMLGASLKEEEMNARQRHAAPERMFKLAFLGRFLGNHTPSVSPNSGSAANDDQSKSFWSQLKLQSAILPLITALVLGLAVWQTGSAKSLEQLAKSEHDRYVVENEEKQALSDKNDQLQADLTQALKAAADPKADLATLTKMFQEVLERSKHPQAGQTKPVPTTKP